jgi:phosphopentomutase
MYGKAASKFAWAEEMIHHDVTLAGVHVHVADALGHAYFDNEETLKACYEWTADWVGRIYDALSEDDDLVILSDHGMVTTFYNDEDDRGMDPAVHSWRAYVASTFSDIPKSVFQVKDWLEPKIGDHVDRSENIKLPEDQLRQLGYIE